MRLTGALQGRPEVSGIEVYLSGPDDELQRPMLGAHADRAAEVAGAVARMSLVPVFAKLPWAVTDLPEIANAVVRAGVSGVTIGGSPPALDVQPERLRPGLGGVTGWLSGPALLPMTLRAVFDARADDARHPGDRRRGHPHRRGRGRGVPRRRVGGAGRHRDADRSGGAGDGRLRGSCATSRPRASARRRMCARACGCPHRSAPSPRRSRDPAAGGSARGRPRRERPR